MDTTKVDLFLMTNAKYFQSHQIPTIKNLIQNLDDDKFILLQSLDLKDPTIAIVLSLFAGGLGIDRFYIGDTGLGFGKLITCGGFGIWAIVDWFLIMGRTREVNFEKLQSILM